MKKNLFRPVARVELSADNRRHAVDADDRLQALAPGTELFLGTDITVLEMQVVADGVLYNKLKAKAQATAAHCQRLETELNFLRRTMEQDQTDAECFRYWINSAQTAPAATAVMIAPCVMADDYRRVLVAAIDRRESRFSR